MGYRWISISEIAICVGIVFTIASVWTGQLNLVWLKELHRLDENPDYLLKWEDRTYSE